METTKKEDQPNPKQKLNNKIESQTSKEGFGGNLGRGEEMATPSHSPSNNHRARGKEGDCNKVHSYI